MASESLHIEELRSFNQPLGQYDKFDQNADAIEGILKKLLKCKYEWKDVKSAQLNQVILKISKIKNPELQEIVAMAKKVGKKFVELKKNAENSQTNESQNKEEGNTPVREEEEEVKKNIFAEPQEKEKEEVRKQSEKSLMKIFMQNELVKNHVLPGSEKEFYFFRFWSKVEEAVWKEYGEKNVEKYKQYMRQRLIFFTKKHNQHLMEGVLEKYELLTPEYLANTPETDLLSNELRQEIEKQKTDYFSSKDGQFLMKKTVIEDGLTQCKKCKGRKIHTIEKQTRSGDEPMTQFHECITCGNKWKNQTKQKH